MNVFFSPCSVTDSTRSSEDCSSGSNPDRGIMQLITVNDATVDGLLSGDHTIQLGVTHSGGSPDDPDAKMSLITVNCFMKDSTVCVGLIPKHPEPERFHRPLPDGTILSKSSNDIMLEGYVLLIPKYSHLGQEVLNLMEQKLSS